MPSLRRTAFSASPRSSPYRSSSYSYSSSFAGTQVARAQARRRSSGSDTTNRRVLADLDWWTVTDGQCENSELEERANDGVENTVAVSNTASNTVFNIEHIVDHLPPLPALWTSDDVSSDVPTIEFAALSIAPRTPARRPRRGPESTNSSLESTPVLAFEALHGMFEDHVSVPAFDTPSPAPLTRSHTFADSFSLEDEFPSFFQDSPIPSLLSLPAFIN